MHRLTITLAAAAAFALGAAPSAFAHAHLVSATPAPGATVKAAPSTLQLTFDDEVEPQFTTVTVTGPKGERVAAGKVQADPQNGKRVSFAVPQLAPGRYSVTWHATDTDTHKTQGSYSFTVAP